MKNYYWRILGCWKEKVMSLGELHLYARITVVGNISINKDCNVIFSLSAERNLSSSVTCVLKNLVKVLL